MPIRSILIGCLLLTLLTATLPSDAGDSEAKAKAILARVATQFAGAQSFSFRYVNTSPSSPDADKDASIVQGYAQKPNKFYFETRQKDHLTGIVVCDGTTEYAYSRPPNTYYQYPAITDFHHILNPQIKRQTLELFGTEMVPILLFLSGDPDYLKQSMSHPVIYAVREKSARQQQVTEITEIVDMTPWGKRGTQIGGVYICDYEKGNGLPLRTAYGVSFKKDLATRSPILLTQQDFTQFHLSAVPLPQAQFTWKPPLEAVHKAPPSPGNPRQREALN